MPIIKRYPKNPILTKTDIPYPVATVHNAGMTKYQDDHIMLFRSHLNTGRCVLGLATSSDGYKFKVNPKPFITPEIGGKFGDYEEYGVEDPRITYLAEEKRFLITYSAYSRHGVRIGLGQTKDFKKFERIALISQADQRNTAIFPEKINGLYVRLDRPHTEINPWAIWISYSKDLVYWGNSKVIIKPMSYHWDEIKVGPGAPPIKTREGWLNIFHGVYQTMSGSVYRLGVALHDLYDPSQVIGVYDGWILDPEKSYEISGYVPNVVFCCGAIPESDNKTLRIYWGGADTVMCAGTASISELVKLCKTSPRNPY
ncbi:glycoside hydrolase family 130 protein [Candidatus Margulisiibacteriota bacterium]